MVSAVILRVEEIKSQHAGISNQQGFILVLSWTSFASLVPGEAGESTLFLKMRFLRTYIPRQMNSPRNMTALWKNECLNF